MPLARGYDGLPTDSIQPANEWPPIHRIYPAREVRETEGERQTERGEKRRGEETE